MSRRKDAATAGWQNQSLQAPRSTTAPWFVVAAPAAAVPGLVSGR